MNCALRLERIDLLNYFLVLFHEAPLFLRVEIHLRTVPSLAHLGTRATQILNQRSVTQLSHFDRLACVEGRLRLSILRSPLLLKTISLAHQEVCVPAVGRCKLIRTPNWSKKLLAGGIGRSRLVSEEVTTPLAQLARAEEVRVLRLVLDPVSLYYGSVRLYQLNVEAAHLLGAGNFGKFRCGRKRRTRNLVGAGLQVAVWNHSVNIFEQR